MYLSGFIMSYDFCVGVSRFIKDNPIMIGAIEMNEYPELCALEKRKNSFFLNRIMNLFQDQSFSVNELTQAQVHLLELLPMALTHKEQLLLHKLIAIVAYALHAQQELHGVAD
jgi:hypothetical protein